MRQANWQGGYKGKPFRLVPAWSDNPWKAGVAKLAGWSTTIGSGPSSAASTGPRPTWPSRSSPRPGCLWFAPPAATAPPTWRTSPGCSRSCRATTFKPRPLPRCWPARASRICIHLGPGPRFPALPGRAEPGPEAAQVDAPVHPRPSGRQPRLQAVVRQVIAEDVGSGGGGRRDFRLGAARPRAALGGLPRGDRGNSLHGPPHGSPAKQAPRPRVCSSPCSTIPDRCRPRSRRSSRNGIMCTARLRGGPHL